MKAVTLHQPWASLIAWGEKQYETRSWGTRYRGPLAIHASRRWPLKERSMCWRLDFVRVLIRHGIEHPSDLPLGVILCVVEVQDVVRTELLCGLSDQERAFGNYAPGRFAWQLGHVARLMRPLPCRGRQGLWDVPPEIEHALRGGEGREGARLGAPGEGWVR
ncbi:ASCH domain-containing protein [Candidatus Nitrospira bockiana]